MERPDPKGMDNVLRCVRGRQQFWVEQRQRARAAKNDCGAGEAQRLIDEYDAFIDILQRQSSERTAGVLRPRR